MTEYRASFDAAIRFSNGGDLTAHGFRVDVPSPDIDQDGIAALFVASLGLLMTESVELSNVKVFANRTRERGQGHRITVAVTWPRAAGWSS
jgi:arylformamidase